MKRLIIAVLLALLPVVASASVTIQPGSVQQAYIAAHPSTSSWLIRLASWLPFKKLPYPKKPHNQWAIYPAIKSGYEQDLYGQRNDAIHALDNAFRHPFAFHAKYSHDIRARILHLEFRMWDRSLLRHLKRTKAKYAKGNLPESMSAGGYAASSALKWYHKQIH